MHSPEFEQRHVVALVATVPGREQYLLERSLPSILAQTRLPDLLCIVFDQGESVALDAVQARVLALIAGRVPLRLLRNYRTSPRAAGSWNTGIDHIFRVAEYSDRPDRVFVALLDDDDAWNPAHLDECLRAAVARDLSVVVSGIVRHENERDSGRFQAIPTMLDERELFIRGQHVQASNLFARLDVLLAVGQFDEQLPSCTDRDICIRLARHPVTRFGAVLKHTVHHFADPRPDRLSHPGSANKLEGITRFLEKYREQFDAAAIAEAEARARSLFGWESSDSNESDRLSHDGDVLTTVASSAATDIRLVIGFVTDSCVPGHVAGLLSDCLELSRNAAITALDVVVLENGPVDPSGSLRELLDGFRRQGLHVWLIDPAMQRTDSMSFLPSDIEPGVKRLPIPVTRSLLSVFVARVAARRHGAWAWIVDDDKRLGPLVATADGMAVRQPKVDLDQLQRLRDSGIDVVLGHDTDAAPLPLFATVRCQLLDLVTFVRTTLSRDPNEPLPPCVESNRRLRGRLRDFHHDLARGATEHLECPFGVEPATENETRGEALVRIAARADRILAGEALTRPLVLDAPADRADRVLRSIRRGGSALFFDPAHLLRFPNSLARIGGSYVRRSDMLVSWLLRERDGLNIVESWSIATRHDRSSLTWRGFDSDRLREDIVGFAFVSALREVAQNVGGPTQARVSEARFSLEQLQEVGRLAAKYVTERTAVAAQSIWRVSGLAKELLSIVRRSRHRASSDGHESLRMALDGLENLAHRLLTVFTPGLATNFRSGMQTIRAQDFIDSVERFESETSVFRTVATGEWSWSEGLEPQRVANGRFRLEALFPTASMAFVGSGEEGVVFTDGTMAFKVFDECARATRETLRQLGDGLRGAKALFPILEFREAGSEAILVREFEIGDPYRGGHGESLVELLREARRRGLCFSNLNPKNLLVTSEGVKLIDYGRSVTAYSENGFRAMAKRAWLTWRWHHRPDLSNLMRASLSTDDLPELDGFDRFMAAVDTENPSPSAVVLPLVKSWVTESRPSTLLDYGCGRGVHATALADGGAVVTAYDPDQGHRTRWGRVATPSVAFTTDRSEALTRGPFDGVICSLVLCELPDGGEYERVLADLRQAVRPDGRVLIVVCNPFFTFGGPTPLHRRRDVPTDVSYEETFSLCEYVGETAQPRQEVHRPLSKLRRDLLRHGFVIDRTACDRTVDLERFEPASEFLALHCRPIPRESTTRDVTLLIRTCSMESETIERQVEHLVTQLEGPNTFTERLLIVDSKPDGFLRQHSAGRTEDHRAACTRLVQHGLIDRVLISPVDPAAIEATNRRWFGVSSKEPHTCGNASVTPQLFGLEACKTEWVLQVDSDVMVARLDRTHDYLNEMLHVVEKDPRAVTVAFNISNQESTPYTECGHDATGQTIPWRVESRASLVHLPRLLTLLPLPNEILDGRLRFTWHRVLDSAVAAGACTSYRGGDRRTFFVHPPNDRKRSVGEWMAILSLIEDGRVPPRQHGSVDLVGSLEEWIPKERAEKFVFVVAGRNVSPGRALRCLESMARQSDRAGEFGAVIIDDGSDPLSREFLRSLTPTLESRVTFLSPRERRGSLANIVLAIESVCTNPQSIVITLDLDDALLTDRVLDHVGSAFGAGADVTIGSMLRTDKHRIYAPDFDDPRRKRGGNVWQHVRAFRKYLFDAIPRGALRSSERFFDVATDWAYMLPVVELAEHPTAIQERLYLYEPSGIGKGDDRARRENVIRSIVEKPRLRPDRSFGPGHVLAGDELVARIREGHGGILIVRHADRPRFAGLRTEERDHVSITREGQLRALALGNSLPPIDMLLSSPVRRCVETATAIRDGLANCPSVTTTSSLALLRARRSDGYDELKAKLGWIKLMDGWIDGRVDPALVMPCGDLATRLLTDLLERIPDSSTPLVVAVTHDFVITGLFAALRRSRAVRVPFLGGILVSFTEARRWLSTEFLA